MEYFDLRITESFNRVLEDKNARLFLEAEGNKYKFIVKNGNTEASFDIEPDASFADSPYVAFCDKTGSWRNLGMISSRMRVVATQDSFDQLRSNMLKAMDDGRKASFPAWGKNAANGRTAQVLKRPALPLKKRALANLSGQSVVKTTIESDSQKALDTYRRILEVIEGAKKRRVEFERQLSAIHADTSLTEAEKQTAILVLEGNVKVFMKELLANKDLAPTIPVLGVNPNAPIALKDYLRHLLDQGASPSQ